MVSACKTTDIIERGNYDRRDGGIGSSCDHHISHAVIDEFSRKPNGINSGSASGGHGRAESVETVPLGDLMRNRMSAIRFPQAWICLIRIQPDPLWLFAFLALF